MTDNAAAHDEVFLVQHARYEQDPPIIRVIGIYRSEEAAKEAIRRAAKLAEFRSYPNNFQIDHFYLDEDEWPSVMRGD